MTPITQNEVDELKSYLYKKIECLRLENTILKIALAMSLILLVILIATTQFYLSI